MVRQHRKLFVAMFMLISLSGMRAVVSAQSTSPNYQVEEVFFGTGGELDASSPNYQAKQTAGELAIGNISSTNFGAQAGFNTTYQPYLEFIVTGGTLDLGTLSPSTTATGTAAFSVRNYLSSGYIVTPVGPVPTQEAGATISALTTPTASSTGTEQFGINLVANTSPATFGAAPVQIPDSSFSFGEAAPGYNTANLYKYIRGETIARSLKSSGQTNYTVSYIVNIAPLTDAGTYTTDQTFVATGTY